MPHYSDHRNDRWLNHYSRHNSHLKKQQNSKCSLKSKDDATVTAIVKLNINGIWATTQMMMMMMIDISKRRISFKSI